MDHSSVPESEFLQRTVALEKGDGIFRPQKTAGQIGGVHSQSERLIQSDNRLICSYIKRQIYVCPFSFSVPPMADLDGNTLLEPKTPQSRFTMQLPRAVPPLSFLRHAVALSARD